MDELGYFAQEQAILAHYGLQREQIRRTSSSYRLQVK
jgi:hypothetical protein